MDVIKLLRKYSVCATKFNNNARTRQKYNAYKIFAHIRKTQNPLHILPDLQYMVEYQCGRASEPDYMY